MIPVRQRMGPSVPSKQVDVSDAELVTQVRNGDVGAFEALYRRHAPRLYSLASRMAGSVDEGEDLLQEIFLQAYRKLGSFKGGAAFGTWVHRLAITHCLDFVRSRQAKNTKLTETLDAESSFEPAAPRDNPIARPDPAARVASLPPGCREAFVLHDVEGLDHREVGQMLGIAEGTSK